MSETCNVCHGPEHPITRYRHENLTECRDRLAAERDALRAEVESLPLGAKRTVVCLCGSTRFWESFRDEGLRLTLEGKIVLSIGICAPDSVVLANPSSAEGKEQKRMLDALHKDKIDLADEVLILNVGGYIGDSTRSELAHAIKLGKVVRWLEPDKADAK